MKRLLQYIPLFSVLLLGVIITAVVIIQENAAKAAFAGHTEEPTVIIDAGHGGTDGGAVSITGTCESEINLSVSNKLRQIMGFLGYDTVMTRESEKLAYPEEANTIRRKKVWDSKRRLELISCADNGVLLSIHQNVFGSESSRGAQALYAPTEGSVELAASIQSAIAGGVDRDNKRVPAQISKNIFIMNNIRCTGVLVECGFLSNRQEAAILEDSGYQTKLSAAIAAGFSDWLSQKDKTEA